MHNIANIKAENPVVAAEILDSKSTARLDFEPLLVLQLAHLLESLKRNLEALLLSHPVLEVLATLFTAQLTDL